MKKLYLNDLLRIEEANLKNVKIRFNQFNGEDNPLDLYVCNPEIVNTQFFLWRTKQRYFNEGQMAICLLKLAEEWPWWKEILQSRKFGYNSN